MKGNMIGPYIKYNDLMGTIKQLLLALIIISALSACSTLQSGNSYEAVSISAVDAQQIATDVISVLVNRYPQGNTLFYVNRSNVYGSLGQALERQLLKAGFGLSTNAKTKLPEALALTYFLDTVKSSSHYRVDIRVGSVYRASFLYRKNHNGNWVRTSVTVRDDTHSYQNNAGNKVYTIENDIKPIEGNSKATTVVDNAFTAALVRRSAAKGTVQKAEKRAVNKVLKKEAVNNTNRWAVQTLLLTRNAPGVLEKHKRRIEAMGYQAYIVTVDGARKLRVGPFGSLPTTRRALQEMRVNGYPDAFLWKY